MALFAHFSKLTTISVILSRSPCFYISFSNLNKIYEIFCTFSTTNLAILTVTGLADTGSPAWDSAPRQSVKTVATSPYWLVG